jgi:hypothetical protein
VGSVSRRDDSGWNAGILLVNMSEQDILKHTTIFLLDGYEGGGRLMQAVRHECGPYWNLYELYRGEWVFDDNISEDSVIRRAKVCKVLLECPLN